VKYVVGRLGVSIPGVFDHEDAMQAGAIGLLQAIDQYRPEAAASFESYALIRIRGSILDAIRSLDVVGRTAREAARAIEAAMRDLHEELGRPADDAEVAHRLGLPLDRYRERLAGVSIATVSLDSLATGGPDEDRPAPGEMLVDEQAPDPHAVAERRDDVKRLAAAIGGLDERQRLVLRLYFQDELTLREIGEVLGVTESRVCQIRSAAVLALRAAMGLPGGRRGGRAGRSGAGDESATAPALPLPLPRPLAAGPVGLAGQAVATGTAYFTSTRFHR
jgi:RNA polymerase sigma factor for flagellar operon FliA